MSMGLGDDIHAAPGWDARVGVFWPRWLAILKISKVPFWIIWITPFIFGYLASGNAAAYRGVAWFLLTVAGACMLEATICTHNELVDQAEDAVNQVNRTYLLRSWNQAALWRFVAVGYTISIIGFILIGTFVRWQLMLPMAATVIIGITYNWGPRIKRRPYFAEAVIAVAVFCCYYTGWLWNGHNFAPPAASWVLTVFFFLTALVKDLPDVAGDEVVGAPGVFSIQARTRRILMLGLIGAGPYIVVLCLVSTALLPPRMLFLLLLAPGGWLALALGERAGGSLHHLIVVYELAFLYAHVFFLVLFALATPSLMTSMVATILFVVRCTALAFRLDPRLVEPRFHWRSTVRDLLTASSAAGTSGEGGS